MAYHYSCMGVAAAAVKRLADLDGYVAEPGDGPEAFRWAHNAEPEDWQAHVAESERATSEAQKAIDKARS